LTALSVYYFQRTTVIIYDVNGKPVKKLLDEKLHSGTYLIKWNGVNNKNLKVSSGVYFYEIKAGAQKFVGKMNLIK